MTYFFLCYPLLTAAMYHLGARAKITAPIWSQYPPWLDALANCASCSGFWYGLFVGIVGLALDAPFLGMTAWWTPNVVGLCAIVWTPVVAAIQENALYALSAVGGEESTT